jgi:cysteine-rich PDZ-binding protein
MVCEKCEKKLSKIITPDPWKVGARNTTKATGETGGRKINENKAISSSRERFNPMGTEFPPCRYVHNFD